MTLNDLREKCSELLEKECVLVRYIDIRPPILVYENTYIYIEIICENTYISGLDDSQKRTLRECF